MIRKRLTSARKRAGGILIEGAFQSMARAGRRHPRAKAAIGRLDVEYDIPYLPTGSASHTLDVYRAPDLPDDAPILFYVHGGGFRILSKDTHWLMAVAFAQRGYIVFSINYRLAPRHPYPAAIEDVCDAYRWVHAHGAEYGGDPDNIVIAGESAGGNLVTALAVASCYDRPEPYARRVRELPVPTACMPACGLLQTTDVARLRRRKPEMKRFILDRLRECEDGYVGASTAPDFDLADPLVVLETQKPDRALPPFFAICGTKDPLLDDTRRLGVALDALGVDNEQQIYPGELHAFHAFLWRRAARQAWADTWAFLGARNLPSERLHGI
jgi:acetyl esterase